MVPDNFKHAQFLLRPLTKMALDQGQPLQKACTHQFGEGAALANLEAQPG